MRGGSVRGAHQREAQRLLRLQVDPPGFLAPWAPAFDRRIVSVERGVPLELIGAQADRTGERCAHQRVRIVGSEPGRVGKQGHASSMLAYAGACNAPMATTPRLGGGLDRGQRLDAGDRALTPTAPGGEVEQPHDVFAEWRDADPGRLE